LLFGKTDDEVPTEEGEAATADVAAFAGASALEEARQAIINQVAAEDVTAESVPPTVRPLEQQEAAGEESLRGFFFGRQAEDIDDTFQDEDPGKKDKGRDFEW
jgi:hypothetical protein